jgi:WD40 repeat protein
LPFETQEIIDPKQDRVLPNGSVLRAGGYSQYGVLHLSAKGKPLRHFAEGDSGMFDVSDDGRFLATYGKKAGTGNPQSLSLRFWDIASGALVTSLPLETRFYLSRFRFSPDGRRLATLHAGGLVRIWDIARKETILSLAADGHAVYDLRFSRDGRFLVGGHGNAPAVIWDMSEAK